jgi:ABC-type microcin C transport system permease subunit YejE
LDYPNGFKAQNTYPIFVNIENPIFFPVQKTNSEIKFILDFPLTGFYDLQVFANNDIIEIGLAEVITTLV